MPTNLLLIRHGETIWNQQRRCQGFSDIPLSDVGEEQANALAHALKSTPLDMVYASDLVRARKTAEIVATPHRIVVKSDARLRELNQGQLEGLDLKLMLADHPDLLKQWMQSPADVVMPGGESMRALQKRGWKAIDEIAANHPEQTIAVVGHNLLNLSIICHAINLDLNQFRKLRMENASISELQFLSHGPVLIRINDTHHLAR